MGEEWGATDRSRFSAISKATWRDAVRNGRKKEFAEAYARHGKDIPDPLSADTRASAVLDWNALRGPCMRNGSHLTRALVAVRKRADHSFADFDA